MVLLSMIEKGGLSFLFNLTKLPEIISHKGPAPWEEGAIEFLKKYPDAALNNERLEIGKKPKKRTLNEVVKNLLPGAEIVEGLCPGSKPILRVPWLD